MYSSLEGSKSIRGIAEKGKDFGEIRTSAGDLVTWPKVARGKRYNITNNLRRGLTAKTINIKIGPRAETFCESHLAGSQSLSFGN